MVEDWAASRFQVNLLVQGPQRFHSAWPGIHPSQDHLREGLACTKGGREMRWPAPLELSQAKVALGLPGLAEITRQAAILRLTQDAGPGLAPGREVEWLFFPPCSLALPGTGQPHPGGDKWACWSIAPPALRTKDAGPGRPTPEDAAATDRASALLVGPLW